MYLDNAATTKVHPHVQAAMDEASFANYNAKYYEEAELTKQQIDDATLKISQLLGCKQNSVIYTSGATESNNQIIKGMYLLYPKGHFITSTIEHKSVLACFEYIEQLGADVSYVKPNEKGQITYQQVKAAIKTNTVFVSIMHVNNETGIINPIDDIQSQLRSQRILFHSDCVQSLGKIEFSYDELDFVTFSGHKIYGPKGIGLLINNTELTIPSLIHGSSQQNHQRAGTLATQLIIGMAKAVELVLNNVNNNELATSRAYVLKILKEIFGSDMEINFIKSECVESILSVRLKGEINQLFLEQNKQVIKASTGSSCSITNPSYVLKECGLDDIAIRETIRLSFSMFDVLNQE